MSNNGINTNVKKWYLENFSDDVGQTLNENATFFGVVVALITRKSIFDYLGVDDSLVCGRVCEKLPELLECDYSDICYLWFRNNPKNARKSKKNKHSEMSLSIGLTDSLEFQQ